MTNNVHQLLLLGMHRSGTSALARVLGLMGGWLGDANELIPAHPEDNPTGYWERHDVLVTHEEFFRLSGHEWDRVAYFSAQKTSPAHQIFLRDKLQAILSKLNEHSPWVLKDPRLCLLLPLWEPLLQAPVYIVAVRDPREIAASLQSSHRGVYVTYFLLALWEKYIRALMSTLQGKRVLFVSYQQLLENPAAQITRLATGLAELGVQGLQLPAETFHMFLDVRLRRSRAVDHTLPTEAQSDLYTWMQKQALAPGPVTVTNVPSSLMVPDAVLAEYEAAMRYERKTAADQEKSLVLAEIAKRLNSLENELKQARLQDAAERAHLEQRLGQERERTEHWRYQYDLMRQDAATQHQRADDADVHHRNLDAKISQLEMQASQLMPHARALEEGIKAMQTSLSWRLTTPLRWCLELIAVRLPQGMEKNLFRIYYALPGVSLRRKRAVILWLHEHMPWLTRRTLSYHFFQYNNRVNSSSSETKHDVVAMDRRMDAQRAEQMIAALPYEPLISILMPVYNIEPCWLMAAVESVQKQFYTNWELCIADDSSTRKDTRAALNDLVQQRDSRIKICFLEENQGIAFASNAALQLVTGEFVALLDHDDELSRDALLEVALVIVNKNPDLIYSDEDKLDVDGSHVDAHFKSDFSLDYLFSQNYICHFLVIKHELLRAVQGFRSGFDGAQDYDLLLRLTEHSQHIVHIPQILYHWRKIVGSTAAVSSAKPKSWDAGQRALADALIRRKIAASAEKGIYPHTYRVRRIIHGSPKVSIIVPFRDKPELLETCLCSIIDKTRYQNYEILGIDNGSIEPSTLQRMQSLEKKDARVRFIRYDAPFNYSAINNYAVRHANGDYLLLLNNDTEVIAPEWLEAMLEHAQRPEVGVVGAKLLYSDNTIQHAGVIVGLGGVAGHAHQFLPANHGGYFCRPHVIQNLSAVTFACALMRRNVFDEIGDLDEQNFRVAFNDIDYCLRVRAAGYLIVYTPYATLYHYESKSRGYEDSPEKQARFTSEINNFQRHHGVVLKQRDPYYNPNFDLNLHSFPGESRYIQALPV